MTNNQLLSAIKDKTIEFSELCEEYIKINGKCKELKKLEDSLKESIKEEKGKDFVGVAYSSNDNQIIFEYSDTTKQSIPAIRKGLNAIDLNISDASLHYSKSAAKEYIELTYKKEEQKQLVKQVNAVIELNSEKTGAVQKIVVRPVKES